MHSILLTLSYSAGGDIKSLKDLFPKLLDYFEEYALYSEALNETPEGIRNPGPQIAICDVELARAGLSLLKVGATAALGAAAAAIIMAIVAAVTASVTLPLFAAVAVVVAGYIGAATLVDMADERFDIKNSVANWMR